MSIMTQPVIENDSIKDLDLAMDKLSLRESSEIWRNVVETTKSAKEAGSLFSIETTFEYIIDGGIEFIVRESKSLDKKPTSSHGLLTPTHSSNAIRLSSHDPFHNPDPNLIVQELSETHQLILNKYNVVDYHLLIVTIEFEPQTDLLNKADFDAAWFVETEIGGLTFFNGGKNSGASQPHKHMQFVPLPILTERDHLPIEPQIFRHKFEPNIVFQIPEFQFVHALCYLDLSKLIGNGVTGHASSSYLERTYLSLFEFLGIDYKNNELRESGELAYNLLLTRRWMLIIIRAAEKYENIAVNSLGFSGTMFVRNEADMKTLKTTGPMKILHEVASKKEKIEN